MPQDDFDALVNRHARLLAAVARRVCGTRHQSLVPDVEQEVRLALWKRLQSGNEIRHPTSYLYKVALATSLAVIRRYRPPQEDLHAEPAHPEPEVETALGRLLPPERARLVEEVIATLEPDEARALRGYMAGLGHEEMARLYGWTPSVARHLVYRTLDTLRAQLAGDRP